MGQRKETDFTFSDSQHTKKKGDFEIIFLSVVFVDHRVWFETMGH